ncbi:hypothetical protein BCR34DRAFT_602833 [Clohesyomyces aquaticus]|uniref:Uncharacterized protein n=1 Tax=Clohesyomyces aquaticus TaxID=1231657 RepID=A0A1Y1ZGZ0_9PLEO|nr:hypothetical protein BCR34DRAFT_602833 [Clohesyomyces aquaticus]
MAPKIEDRWLWLGLGAFTFIAIKSVSLGLQSIVSLARVSTPPPHPIPAPPTASHKEDNIKTSSLETLATCSNIEIRKAATKILCSRFFAHQRARDTLFRQLQSQNPETARRARLAFNLLCDYGVVQDVMFLPASGSGSGAGGNRNRSGNMPAGWRRGLRGGESMYTARERRRAQRARNRQITEDEISVEERELRRRRREAMVINEGDRPVSQEDVWMRDGSGRMSTEEARDPRELYEDLRRLADALASADETAEGLRVRLENLGLNDD